MNRRTVCMIAYANYFTDARIKNYVEALLGHGYRVDVFALGSQSAPAQPGLRVFAVADKYWGDRALRYALAQCWFALRTLVLVGWHGLKERYRLVHVHNMPNMLVFSALIARLCGARIILDVHDTMPEVYATKFDLPLDHPLIALLRWEERASAWFSDQVITTNVLHKEVLIAHGIPSAKIEVILNTGNPRLFRPVVDKPVHTVMMLVYHGTIAKRLGIDLILQALAIARDALAEVKLVLIGDGDYLPAAKEIVQSLGLTECVEFMGFIPVEDLPQHLAQADIGVVGNRAYNEVKHNYMLPVKMLEYAAMEIPTLTPRLRVIARYFDEQSALYYAPDDAQDLARRMIEVWKNPQVGTAVKKNLRTFNLRYNWPVMESIYLQIVRRLLAGVSCTESAA